MPSALQATCDALIAARRQSRACPLSPADLPSDIDAAYAMQAALIVGWGEPVAGWKIGRVLGKEEARFGVNRFVGPIFASTISSIQPGSRTVFPAIEGGASALEAEVIAVLGPNAQARAGSWTAANVDEAIAAWHIGIEVAGCPVAEIGAMGALASISVFGNNLGLLIGPKLDVEAVRDLDQLACETRIDAVVAGGAVAGALPGGPRTAAAFALNHLARTGIVVEPGTVLSTGAITGVHAVIPGQNCTATFAGQPRLECIVTAL